jgi:hypothetical protein
VRRRFDLGSGLGLAEARRKAEDVRRAVRDGADPTTERRAARQRAQAARDGEGTVGALLDTYFTKGPGGQRRRAARNKRLVETVFRKALGIISVVLGHAHIAEGATAIYARSRYQREHREALQAFANEIDGLITVRNNVLSFAPR